MIFDRVRLSFCGRFQSPHTQDALKKLAINNGAEVKEARGQSGCDYMVTTEAEVRKVTSQALVAVHGFGAKAVNAAWLVDSVAQNKLLDPNDSAYALDTSGGKPSKETQLDGVKRKRQNSSIVMDQAESTQEVGTREAPVTKKPRAQDEKQSVQPKATKIKANAKAKAKSVSQKASVDESCPLRNSHHVYVDDGTVYDAALNQTDIKNNNNKFYYVQLLETNHGDNVGSYSVWTHWGRVGESGQNKLEQNLSIENGKKVFAKKFKDKTGLDWEKRNGKPKAGKYTVIEKDYAESDEEMDEPPKSNSAGKSDPGRPQEPPKCILSPEVQRLVTFIFNAQTMKKSMESMNFNSKKLPLGKLSKGTLEKGYLALKELGEVISNPSLAQSKYKEPLPDVYNDLTSKYYTVIPHDFGRQRPVVISSEALLKAEIQLVESLGNMEIANEIMKETEHPRDAEGNPINSLDAQFKSLNLEEAIPLDKESDEFKYLSAYFGHSDAGSHSTQDAEIQEIFRIRRSEEFVRFEAAGFDAAGMARKKGKVGDCRRLLWHGSRGCNFSGILSQGLRIAPPEAPANGYAFGKGVYLADRACKSGSYCDPWTSNNLGLLLLTETQCGDPVYLKRGHEYGAKASMEKKGLISTKMEEDPSREPARWMECSNVNKDLKGALMPDPDVPLPPLHGNANEYIVYSVEQIKIRYIFMLKWSKNPYWGIG